MRNEIKATTAVMKGQIDDFHPCQGKFKTGVPAPYLTQLPLVSHFMKHKEKNLFPHQCLFSRSKNEQSELDIDND